MQSEYIASVGALIYAKNTGRFLFLLRSNSSYAGMWGLVGGKIDANETSKQALIREINEEIGIRLSDTKIIPVDLFTSTNKKFMYNTYLVILEEEFLPTLNNEHSGYCWCTLTSYPKPLHPGVYGTMKIEAIQQKIETILSL